MAETAENPKAFISYSWTSQRHQELVREWAERLLGDGIDVILDIFDLKEGHDKYAFMESMVTDPTVTHVLLFCDGEYARKANAQRLSRSQLEVRWPLHGESYALLTFLATPCS